jgi:hypothetical protein
LPPPLRVERPWLERLRIEGVFTESVCVDGLEHRFVRGLEHDWRCDAGVDGLEPASDTQTPSITRRQSREVERRLGRDQIVAAVSTVREELGGHDGTQGVLTDVAVDVATPAVAQVASRRIGATRLEWVSEHVPFRFGALFG